MELSVQSDIGYFDMDVVCVQCGTNGEAVVNWTESSLEVNKCKEVNKC